MTDPHDVGVDPEDGSTTRDDTAATEGLVAADLGDGAVPDADTSTRAPDEDAPAS